MTYAKGSDPSWQKLGAEQFRWYLVAARARVAGAT